MNDIDAVLRSSGPEINAPSGTGPAVGAMARAAANGHRPSVGSQHRAGAIALGVGAAAAVVAGGVVISQSQINHKVRAEPSGNASSTVSLVAAKYAPAGLPLPSGVTIEDAKAFVTSLLAANPSLTNWAPYVLDHGTLVGHEKGGLPNIPKRMQESGVTAAYIFYAHCQWERTMLGKPLQNPLHHNGKTDTFSTDDPGLAALISLGDPSSWSATGHRAPVPLSESEHGGIVALPGSAAALRDDFETNCTHGFGDAPAATK